MRQAIHNREWEKGNMETTLSADIGARPKNSAQATEITVKTEIAVAPLLIIYYKPRKTLLLIYIIYIFNSRVEIKDNQTRSHTRTTSLLYLTFSSRLVPILHGP